MVESRYSLEPEVGRTSHIITEVRKKRISYNVSYIQSASARQKILISMCKYFFMGADMNSKTENITLKVNAKLYEIFTKHCKERGLIISRQFEIFMENQLKKWREGANDE